LITAKDKIIITTKSPILVDGIAPQASPIMSDPKFGSRNSALEIAPSNFIVLSIAFPIVS